MRRRTSALTFVEVLACLLVLSLGMLSAIAVARYAVGLSREAIASSLAMPTAQSVLCNARQTVLGSPSVLDWMRNADVWTGYVNGFYVRRTITNGPSILGTSATGSVLRFANVTVDVYWSAESNKTFTISERVAFHGP